MTSTRAKSAESTVDGVQDSQWITVSAGAETLPTKVVFDSWGDEFIGRYKGPRTVTPGSGDAFTVYIFTQDGTFLPDNETPEEFSVSATNALRSGMKKVRPGALVRLTYLDDIDSGNGNFIKNIRIDVAR